MARRALADLAFAFAVSEIPAPSSLFSLEVTSPTPGFVGNWLRHAHPFPFADFVMHTLTSRRGLVQL